jgi:Zn-dependent protease
MNMDGFNLEAVRTLLLFAPPFILSLSIHEFAHAWVANRLGDSTARYMGRMTIDPMAHISWVGTVIFPAIAVLTGAPLFGWANPVPIDERNFRKPRRDMALTAAAGPASNLIIGFVLTATLALVVHQPGFGQVAAMGSGSGMRGAAIQMLVMAVQLNLFLAFFNLIPLPPLDGGKIIQGVVGKTLAAKIDQLTPYGSWILLLLFFTGFLKVIAIPVYLLMNTLFALFGLA